MGIEQTYEESLPRLKKMVEYAKSHPNLKFSVYREEHAEQSVNPTHVMRYCLENGHFRPNSGIHIELIEEEGRVDMVFVEDQNDTRNLEITEILRKNDMLVKMEEKEFVTFKGLLYVATKFFNLISITPEPIMEWCDPTKGSYFFKSTVVVRKDGTEHTYTDYGDATHNNVGRFIKPHTFRMASTRATVRALRLALGVGITGLDEIGEDDDDSLSKVTNKIKGKK